jgi:hypothetical protein
MSRCEFHAVVQKFQEKGDKTNWTYLLVSEEIAESLNPGDRRSFRVSGTLDAFKIKGVALIPGGNGTYILPLNAAMRREIRKPVGAVIHVVMKKEHQLPEPDSELIQCLQDDPDAWAHFSSLTPSHQRYFSAWVASAKTTATRDKRITLCVSALAKKWDYGLMIRSMKKES